MAQTWSKPGERTLHESLVRCVQPLLTLLKELLNDPSAATSSSSGFSDRIRLAVDRLVIKIARLLDRHGFIDLRRRTGAEERSITKAYQRGPLPTIAGLVVLLLFYRGFLFNLPAAGLSLWAPTSLVFHSLVFLSLACFLRFLCTDPGESQDMGPDSRSHFCRTLQRNIPRMDHYCPWLGNTVGFENHKYFMLFSIYASSLTGLVGVNILQTLLTSSLPAQLAFDLIRVEGVAAIVSSLIFPFSAFHCWLLAHNLTTPEFRDILRNDDGSLDVSGVHSIYDEGLLRNVKSVMGDNPWLWWLPVAAPSLPIAHREVREEEDDGCLLLGSAVPAAASSKAVPCRDDSFLTWTSPLVLEFGDTRMERRHTKPLAPGIQFGATVFSLLRSVSSCVGAPPSTTKKVVQRAPSSRVVLVMQQS